MFYNKIILTNTAAARIIEKTPDILAESLLRPDLAHDDIKAHQLDQIGPQLIDYLKTMQAKVSQEIAHAAPSRIAQSQRWLTVSPIVIQHLTQYQNNPLKVIKYLFWLEVSLAAGHDYKIPTTFNLEKNSDFPNAIAILRELMQRVANKKDAQFFWTNELQRIAKKTNKYGRRALSGFKVTFLKDGTVSLPSSVWRPLDTDIFEKKKQRYHTAPLSVIRQQEHRIENILYRSQEYRETIDYLENISKKTISRPIHNEEHQEFCEKLSKLKASLDRKQVDYSRTALREVTTLSILIEHAGFAINNASICKQIDITIRLLKLRILEQYEMIPNIDALRRTLAKSFLAEIHRQETAYPTPIETIYPLAKAIHEGYAKDELILDSRDTLICSEANEIMRRWAPFVIMP